MKVGKAILGIQHLLSSIMLTADEETIEYINTHNLNPEKLYRGQDYVCRAQ